MTVSTDIIQHSRSHIEIKDDRGRVIKIRRLNALDRLRILKAAGPNLSQNDGWLNMAALAASVVEIDGTPRIMPSSERLIEAAVAELDDAGLAKIADALQDDLDNYLFSTGGLEGKDQGTSN